MYCARVRGRNAHVWSHIKGKTPILDHGCLHWNRTWASLTVWCFQGQYSSHQDPKCQFLFNAVNQSRGRRPRFKINSRSIISVLLQCPVCLIRQQFQHRICSKHRTTLERYTKIDGLIGTHTCTDTCRYLPTVQWIWAVGFKALLVKEERQLRAAVL